MNGSWLVTDTGKLLDFGQQIVQLRELQQLADEFPENGKSFQTALLELLSGTQGEKTAALSGETFNQLSGMLKKLLGLDGNDRAEELAFLGRPLGDLKDERPAYNWNLLDRDPENTGTIGDTPLMYKLSAGIKAGMGIQSFPVTPEGMPDAIKEAASLSLAFDGSLMLGAQVSLQQGVISFGIGASAGGKGQIKFFYGHSPDTITVAALVDDISSLISPFDLPAVHKAISKGGALNGVIVTTEASLAFSGNIGFATTSNILVDRSGSVAVGGSVEAGFTLSESSQFDYFITQAESDPNCLAVRLTRARSHAETVTEKFGLTIDLTGWAKKVYPKIRQQLTDAGDFIDKLEGYLPGDAEVSDRLEKALNKALDDNEFAPLVKRALGFGQDIDIGEVIAGELLPKLETTSGIWMEGVEAGAATSVAELLQRVDLDVELENTLQLKLEQALTEQLTNLHAKLSDKIKSVLSSDSGLFTEASEEFNRLGHSIQTGLNGINRRVKALSEPVRKELDAIQERLAKLAVPFEDAGKAKILYKYEALRREEQGKELDIEFVIKPEHPDAETVFRDLLTGKIGSHLLKNHSTAIKVINGSFERYRQIVESDKFNLVLFDIGFGGATKTKIDSRIRVDAQGNIILLTRQDWEKTYSRKRGVRRLVMANSHEISAASQDRDMTVSFNLIMEETQLSADQLRHFLKPFEIQKLLQPGSVGRAMEKLQGGAATGSLELGLALTSRQMDRLLSRTESQILSMGAVLYEELAQRYPPNLDFKQELPDYLEALGEAWGNRDLDIEAAIITIGDRKKSKTAEGVTTFPDDELTEKKWERLYFWLDSRAASLVGRPSYRMVNQGELPGRDEDIVIPGKPGMDDAFAAMQEIREMTVPARLEAAGAEERENAENDLLKELNARQEEIDDAMRSWHAWGDDAVWWLYDKPEPRLFTIALFTLLARLSGNKTEASVIPKLSAALTLKTQSGTRRHPIE